VALPLRLARRRDLALLRLVGGGRRHVRRLLTGEALLLGLIGTVTGVPAGVAVMALQTRLLVGFGFVPDGFTGQWRDWILGASAGAGLGLGLAGVLVAARRAARVRPLDALRDPDAGRVIVTMIGVFLGTPAAASTYLAVLATTSAVTGTAPLDLPWTLMAVLAVVAFVITGLTSLLTSWSATRAAPGSLLGARE
jgi:putative ABC transport system permease protein